MAKTAFVTGGTGFIGINLVELLVKQGWEVTALHRPTSDVTYLQRFPVELRVGSVTDLDSLKQAIPPGANVVFHAAGDANFWSKRNAQQTETNVDGTRNMVDAAAAQGVKTFIHTSSVSAWGRVSGTITEETPLRGRASWINYERTKHLGELEALEGIDRGMKVVILNPGGVAGPYDANTCGKLFLLLRDQALPATAPGITNIAHVHDVVRAHLAAVTKGRSGERYILAGYNCEIADLIAEVVRVSGARKAPAELPAFLLKLFGQLSVTIAAMTGNEPDLTPEIAEITSTRDLTFSSEKAIRELGFRIQPMKSAVRDCYEWLVKEGYLEGRKPTGPEPRSPIGQ